jgi:hypothetical protein
LVDLGVLEPFAAGLVLTLVNSLSLEETAGVVEAVVVEPTGSKLVLFLRVVILKW